MYKIDAKGLVCPKPVILAKKALVQHDTIYIEVDNSASKENLEKMAVVMGLESETKSEGNIYAITLSKTESTKLETEKSEAYIIVINREFMGSGSEELGNALMKSFIYTVTETEEPPKTILFYNGGVKLTTKGSQVLGDLEKLSQNNVEILSCGTCLNYYGLSDALEVGEITNMYEILKRQQEAGKVLYV